MLRAVSSSFSRADLLRRGAGGAVVLAAAGSGLGALAPAAAAALPDGDLAYVRLAIGVELLLADFEANALAAGKLSAEPTAQLKRIAADDQAHYTGLAQVLGRTGQTPATAADIDFAYPKGSYDSQASIVELGSTIATLALGAYLGAVENVQTASLRLPLGQIAANEAQHVSAFAVLLGRPLVGHAFAPALQIADVSNALSVYES
jgi:Ferritin-like domain